MLHSDYTNTDHWRILIPGRSASEILVLANGRNFILPEVVVPRDQRLAWHLNEQIKRNWQLPVLSVVPIRTGPNHRGKDSTNYHLAELMSPKAALPPGMNWANLASLTKEMFQDPEDFDAGVMFFHPSGGATEDGPFARLGWFEDLAAWVKNIASSRGLGWNGRFEQFHAAACFSLIRFGTSPQALWFKAVGEPNTREFNITQVLADCLPAYVPRLLAVRPDCNGWLAKECPGTILHDTSDPDLWRSAAYTLAELQVESVPHTVALLRAGAHLLQSVLSDFAIERFVRAGAALLAENSEQAALNPRIDDLMDIASRASELRERIKIFGIPDALGHLDLNGGNIVVSPEQCTYLDWAEAYVGCPFVSFEYLLQAFRRKFGTKSPHETTVVETYLTSWQRVCSRSTIREAWTRTSFLALFAYTLRCIAASEPWLGHAPDLANYVRSLLRKLKRQVGNLQAPTVGVK